MNPNDLAPSASSTPAVTPLDRRAFLGRASLFGAAAVLSPTALLLGTRATQAADPSGAAATDLAVLNFALNLEYLEAEYYLHAVRGNGLSSTEISGSGTPGEVTVKTNSQVNFDTTAIREYAAEIAHDELDHVHAIRRLIKSLGGIPAARPAIDLQASFAGLGSLIGVPNFDPFASEVNFLLGAFIFEDVGVTAYNGAAPLVTSKGVLGAAASILAVEAYHAGSVRTVLYSKGGAVQTLVNKISGVRSSLGGNRDQGIRVDGKANLVPTNSQGLAFTRTTRQVLNIVYGAIDAPSGLFFPNGLNGAITK